MAEKLLRTEGSISIEAAVVMPFVIIIICGISLFNVYFFSKIVSYGNMSRSAAPDYCDIHRSVSAVFDAGGDVFHALFGE
ncbi:MAG: hypothetical protein IJS71_01225 [Clostridia bacterium]|nr:hypothetical protein [Clostridia bacterium]